MWSRQLMLVVGVKLYFHLAVAFHDYPLSRKLLPRGMLLLNLLTRFSAMIRSSFGELIKDRSLSIQNRLLRWIFIKKKYLISIQGIITRQDIVNNLIMILCMSLAVAEYRPVHGNFMKLPSRVSWLSGHQLLRSFFFHIINLNFMKLLGALFYCFAIQYAGCVDVVKEKKNLLAWIIASSTQDEGGSVPLRNDVTTANARSGW